MLDDVIVMPRNEMEWLFHALRNVQTRNSNEMMIRDKIRDRITELLLKVEVRYAISLDLETARLCIWAIHEGRIRNNEELLIQARLLKQVHSISGGNG